MSTYVSDCQYRTDRFCVSPLADWNVKEDVIHSRNESLHFVIIPSAGGQKLSQAGWRRYFTKDNAKLCEATPPALFFCLQPARPFVEIEYNWAPSPLTLWLILIIHDFVPPPIPTPSLDACIVYTSPL